MALRNDDHTLFDNISTLVEELLEQTGFRASDNKDAAEVRMRFTKNLCDMLRIYQYETLVSCGFAGSVYAGSRKKFLLMVGSAIGHEKTFRTNFSGDIEDILGAGHLSYPSALNAAVAANKQSVALRHLYWLLTQVKRRPVDFVPGSRNLWKVAMGMINALRIAIRLGHDTVGELILQAFASNENLVSSLSWYPVREMYRDCVKYGNCALFSIALYWKNNKEVLKSTDPCLSEPLKLKDFLNVAHYGTPGLLRGLIRNGRIDVNLMHLDCCNRQEVKLETPLWLTLQDRCYRMAKVLLEEGADIEGIPPGQKKTAYFRAIDTYNGDAQWFLLRHGAAKPAKHQDLAKVHIIWEDGKRYFEDWEPYRYLKPHNCRGCY